MAEARDHIFQALRSAWKRNPAGGSTDAVAERLARHPSGPKPGLAGPPLDVFVTRAEASRASLSRVSDESAAVQALLDYLDERGLTRELVTDSSPLLRRLPWPEDVSVRQPPLRAGDSITVTLAYAGVAETGSLVLLSSEQTPTALNFLPEHYICLLPATRIVAHLEDLWALMRTEAQAMPRTVNLITGPSRTADVEQTIQMGAHGPRSVHIVLMEY